MTNKQQQLMEHELKSFFESPPKGIKIVYKTGWFWTLLNYLIIGITFGANRAFMTRYITTIGPYICFPESWKQSTPGIDQLAVIKHELCHTKQFKQFGLGSYYLGILTMGLVYIFFPIPMFFAMGRYWIERVAYLEGIKTQLIYGDFNLDQIDFLIDHAVTNLSTGQYAWTYILSGQIRTWFKRKLDECWEEIVVMRDLIEKSSDIILS